MSLFLLVSHSIIVIASSSLIHYLSKTFPDRLQWDDVGVESNREKTTIPIFLNNKKKKKRSQNLHIIKAHHSFFFFSLIRISIMRFFFIRSHETREKRQWFSILIMCKWLWISCEEERQREWRKNPFKISSYTHLYCNSLARISSA